ncbi:MAG: MBL fold metallo-hydrolase [Rhodobacteraceae bacterium]|nr:MBL fold metallo-hydrolase [Paracoccaceae bacterium]
MERELKNITMVLLGTRGGPRLSRDSSWPTSTLLDVGGKLYLIDAGLGVTRQIVEAGYDLKDIQTIIITHHHSDHNLELGPLLHTKWVSTIPRKTDVYGPPGLKLLLEGFYQSQKFDIETRIKDEQQAPFSDQYNPVEYTEGQVLNDNTVKVTALRVQHPPIYHCYALRFEIGDKSVVLSSDTAYFPQLSNFSRKADVLLHEVMHYEGVKKMCQRLEKVKPNLLEHITNGHTRCEDVGRIATEAEVGHLVLNHFTPTDEKKVRQIDFYHEVRKTWAGKLSVGADLMRIEI